MKKQPGPGPNNTHQHVTTKASDWHKLGALNVSTDADAAVERYALRGSQQLADGSQQLGVKCVYF